MISIYKISEKVMSLIEGMDISSKPKFAMSEVKEAIIQVVNSLIKSQYFTEEMAAGERIPDGAVLTEYDNIAVESYKGVSRAELPAMPVKLPLSMGIYHVGKTDNYFNGFIPYGAGELQMLGEEPLISDIMGQVAYEPSGKFIVFNRDITDNNDDNAINEVYIRLVIKDVSLYSDWEGLPIPASMEAEVIQSTFQLLMQQQPTNKKVDVVNKQEVK